mmetsp:Transcript_43228/g.112033  ORF Transcript_43228/g.112033 Transcript_43228/m.112033 type:complete len:248 (+) Transcript_43228:2062-2805(+)
MSTTIAANASLSPGARYSSTAPATKFMPWQYPISGSYAAYARNRRYSACWLALSRKNSCVGKLRLTSLKMASFTSAGTAACGSLRYSEPKAGPRPFCARMDSHSSARMLRGTPSHRVRPTWRSTSGSVFSIARSLAPCADLPPLRVRPGRENQPAKDCRPPLRGDGLGFGLGGGDAICMPAAPVGWQYLCGTGRGRARLGRCGRCRHYGLLGSASLPGFIGRALAGRRLGIDTPICVRPGLPLLQAS